MMLIIGIGGGTGSGKTTVVESLLSKLNPDCAVVISQDNYYKDLKHLTFVERKKMNFDHPTSIDFDLLISHLEKLKNGQSIPQPIYSFASHERTENNILVDSKKVIIVEGILVLTNEKLRNLFDLKVFIDADSDERLIRRIRRDIKERGRSVEEVLNRYQDTLKPMHEQFIEPTKKWADIIIPNMKEHKAAIEILRAYIENNK